jgi:hypothetical protein
MIEAVTARIERAKEGKEALTLEYYLTSPQQMYKADAVQFWVNSALRDDKGLVIRDIRYEVKRADLL